MSIMTFYNVTCENKKKKLKLHYHGIVVSNGYLCNWQTNNILSIQFCWIFYLQR